MSYLDTVIAWLWYAACSLYHAMVRADPVLCMTSAHAPMTTGSHCDKLPTQTEQGIVSKSPNLCLGELTRFFIHLIYGVVENNYITVPYIRILQTLFYVQ